MAQDEYYYEIQLTNKQLVFYFLAGATALILSFLAGIMVGRGVETRPNETRVREDAVAPVIEEPTARRSASVESYSYPQQLTNEKPNESLATPRSAVTPVRVAVATPPVSASPASARSGAAAATPRGKAAVGPTPARTPARPSPTVRRVEAAPSAETGSFQLQVGAFKDKAGADALVARLKGKGYPAVLVKPDAARGGLYNVRVGPYRTRPDAERMKARLEQEKLKPFVVKP